MVKENMQNFLKGVRTCKTRRIHTWPARWAMVKSILFWEDKM